MSGLGEISQLRGIAGITVQDGHHDTAGSLETLKWSKGKYDPERRMIDVSVFGGFYDHSKLGLWTEPTTPLCLSCLWACLMNVARQANYSYRFQFSEDLRSADIRIRGNVCILCGCCLPCFCCPFCPSVTFPKWCCNHSMKQADDSEHGTHWERYKGVCGATPKKYYDLRTVFNADGTDGPFIDKLPLQTPKQVQITC